MRKIVTLTVLFVVAASVAFAQTRSEFTVGGDGPEYTGRDITVVQTWDYLVSGFGFGVGIAYEGIGAGNIWITDWDVTICGLYEFDRAGTQLPGFIPAIDDGSAQDCAYIIEDEYWVVGYYYENRIDFYDDSGILDAQDGPAGWGEPWGVAYSNDENMLIYLGSSDQIAYGAYTDPGTAISWTTLDLPAGTGNFTGLGYYYPEGRSEFGKYLFGIARVSDPWTNTLFVWDVDGSGVPDVDNPAYTFDMNPYLVPADEDGAVAGIEWDGEHLWVLDQADPDYVTEFDLGISGVSITPTSLGNIKASFR